MSASANPHQTRAHRWPLFVGTIAATALLLTALLDFGDPLQSARDEVELGAAARADAVRATWSRLCATADDPISARHGFAVEVPDVVPAFAQSRRAGRDQRTPSGSDTTAAIRGTGSERRPPNMGLTAEGRAARDQQDRAPIAAALARAARAARSQGGLERAVELASIATDRARGRDPVLLAQILLDRCRWAAAAEAPADVATLRLDLITNGDPSATIDGTSVRLLAAMIAPIDAALARTELESTPRALPPPNDRLQIVRGEAVITWDPWWTVLEERLHGIAPGIDWARRLVRGKRRAEAVRRFFGNQLNGADAQWRFAMRDGATFALRRQGAHTRVLHTTQAAIVQRLSQDLAAGNDQPYTVQFHRGGIAAAPGSGDPHRRSEAGDVVRALEALDGERLGFTVHRKDALRTGQAEAARLSAVRAGLITLAVAILCATMLATRALQRTRRLERMRSTFVASVTHDLRTPIQSILLMSETLERGRVAREASRKRYFTTIRHEAQRLRRFVEDILESARIDRGEAARVDRQAVSSAAFFATMEQDLRTRAERDGATVEFVLERMPEELTIDPDGALRITWNLFENALRYGRIDEQPADVRVEAACANGVLTITVHDQGPGVPSRFASSIFEPFERADAEERGPTGTGLGLSIVRAIARAHGGDAQLLPSATGARFAASLPLTPPAPQKDPAA